MTDERYQELVSNEELDLTRQERADGWHFCWDWDGLLIGPDMEEAASCSCGVIPEEHRHALREQPMFDMATATGMSDHYDVN